jgi:TPR repeat protein
MVRRREDTDGVKRPGSSGRKASKGKPTSPYDQALSLATSAAPDWPIVLRLLSEAMKKGDMRAAYALATWNLYGKDALVKKDKKEAVRLFRLAADAGIPKAMYELAVCYQNGEGVQTSDRKAFALYLASGLKGDTDSLVEVARCYKYGRGVERNSSASRIFLQHALELGVEV